MPVGPQNDVNLYYVDAALTLDLAQFTFAYGRADNPGVETDCDEVDFFFTLDITKSTKLEGYITWMNFSGDTYNNYVKGGTTLSYYF